MTQFARFFGKICVPDGRTESKTAPERKKTPSPDRETVFSSFAHVPLSDCGTGAVTSVRVTPLENVRLLRMVVKSLDMLR